MNSRFALLLALSLGGCKSQIPCPKEAYNLAFRTIEERNSTEISARSYAIARWPQIKTLMANEGNQQNALIVMTNYCSGLDKLIDQMTHTSNMNTPKLHYLFIDDYNDIGKIFTKVEHHSLTGNIFILENEHYGCFKDVRKRNELLLQEIWKGPAGNIVASSGLIMLLMDAEGNVVKGTNSVTEFVGYLEPR
jgi:hypothetical protein